KPRTTQVAAVSTPQSSARILLVEDNAVNTKVAILQLRRLGYSADTAENGLEAIEAIRNAKDAYDLVLMDCQMPEMDGFETTHAIREQEKNTNSHLTIVAMTANAMEGDRDLCIQAGMDDYLSKPIKHENLNRMLDKWLVPPRPRF
ncbi:MAG: response regulator, partial [Chloroflexota bacterium]